MNYFFGTLEHSALILSRNMHSNFARQSQKPLATICKHIANDHHNIVDQNDVAAHQIVLHLCRNGQGSVLPGTFLRWIQDLAIRIGRRPHRADRCEDEPSRMPGLLAVCRHALQCIRNSAPIAIKFYGQSIQRPKAFRHRHVQVFAFDCGGSYGGLRLDNHRTRADPRVWGWFPRPRRSF